MVGMHIMHTYFLMRMPTTISLFKWYSPLRQPTAATFLAAARSRSGSDSPPDCHSTPSRRFATRRARLIPNPDKFGWNDIVR